MTSLFKTTLIGAAAMAMTGGGSFASDLIITFDDLNPGPKAAFEAAVEKFKGENPDINVTVNINDREAHKTAIRNFLTADAPDVTTWYAGNRMRPFVDAGLFADVSDVWEANGFSETLASTKPSMTVDGKQYGVPYTYYQWGVYYRKDIFDNLGLSEPKTWDEFLAAMRTINESGVKPLAIGTKFLWPAAGVFDYLNLRQNGYDFHNQLTAGEVKYTDPRVRDTFARWKEMLDAGGWVDNHATMDWQEGMSLFIKGEAAMYIMGNFAVGSMRDGGLTDDQIDFFQFPVINPDIPNAEEAPTDTWHMPTNAKNKENAKKWLAFVARADVQTEWNKSMGQLPINSKASVGDDKFLQQGFETLNAAAGIAQFYDRDAPAEMAKGGMEGFQEFMVKPDRLDAILERLDKIQERVYK
jgi:multiple sugar transport system substrate-binding protein